jgi:hypothetical protein
MQQDATVRTFGHGQRSAAIVMRRTFAVPTRRRFPPVQSFGDFGGSNVLNVRARRVTV